SVQVLDKEIEKQAFAETFLSRGAVATVEDLVEYFKPALMVAAEKTVAPQPAERWLGEESRPTLLEALRKAAQPLECDARLKLLPPFELFAESESLARERMEQMQRRLTERRASDQLQHVQRATELLKQFQALRAS